MPDSRPTPDPAAERRAGPRLPCPPDTRGELFDPEGFVFQPARVLNLSAGGVALLAADPAARGTALWVEMELRGRPRTLPARVRHVRRTGEGWLHGCQLDVPLSPAELRALVGC
jgi:hypothetical protein